MCAHHVVRRRVGVLATLAALLLVPVALAWACTPLAKLELDRSAYAPGDIVEAEGTYFLANTRVVITLEGGQLLAAVQTTDTGYLRATFPAPSHITHGVIVATARDKNGDTFSAPASILVRAPVKAPANAGEPAPVAAATAPAVSPEPAAAPQPAATASAVASGRTSAAAATASPERSTRRPAPAPQIAAAPAAAQPVTAAPRTATATATATAQRPAARSVPARPAPAVSERSAVGAGAWGTVGAAESPALQPSTAATATSRTPVKTAALVLLALGVLALGSGFAVDARRRARAR